MPKNRVQTEECVFLGCSRLSWAGDLCHGHYKQKQRGKQLKPLKDTLPRRKEKNTLCIYPECENISILKKLCRKHYMKLKRELERKKKENESSE